MSRTASPSSATPYGVARVCRIWRVARATVYRHRMPARTVPPRRPGPTGPIADPALVQEFRRVLHDSPFHGEGHRTVWARLRIAGIRTSKRRVLRLIPSAQRLDLCAEGIARGAGGAAAREHDPIPARRRSNLRRAGIMRENALLAPSRTGSPRGPRAHDGTIIPGAVDVMWGTALTTTITGQGQAAVLVAVDHHSAECVGIGSQRAMAR